MSVLAGWVAVVNSVVEFRHVPCVEQELSSQKIVGPERQSCPRSARGLAMLPLQLTPHHLPELLLYNDPYAASKLTELGLFALFQL